MLVYMIHLVQVEQINYSQIDLTVRPRGQIPKTILPLLFLLVAALTASATTLHVPADFPTIQEAVDAAADADTVLVSPGDYNEHSLLISKGVAVISVGGPEATRIYSSESPAILLTDTTARATIQGFTITGESVGGGTSAGGIVCTNAQGADPQNLDMGLMWS